jgi:hypothetical protein
MNQDETKPPERRPCSHFVLARGVVAQVEYCVPCAVFHVAVESVSIRFHATALRDLRDTLSIALAAYERALEQTAAEEPPERALGDGMH